MVNYHMAGLVSGISTYSLTPDYFEANVRYPNILSASNLVCVCVCVCVLCVYTH